jgi:hypothetical protein
MNLFARLPYIIDKVFDIENIEIEYARYLDYLGGDYELWVAACDSLRMNGVNLNKVNSKVPSLNLNYIIKSYLAWSNRDGGKKHSFDLTAQANLLLEALDS